jgi:D-glycero-D-manno-heptose 1,7-bisphosphate phosphatase
MLTKEQLWGSRIDNPTTSMISSKKQRDIQFPKCVIGFDRDGIINECRSGPISTADDFVPISGALDAIAFLRTHGHKIVIIFDQPLISQGLIVPATVDSVNQHMLKLLGEHGCPSIDGIYYSTTNLPKVDIWAKPNPAMFKRAENEQGISFRQGGYYVGDSIEDLEAAVAIKATPVLIKTGNYAETLAKLNTFAKRKLKSKVQIFNTLQDFARSLF